MKAEIVAIGTELLLGEIVDTDGAFLASQLPLLGIDLYFISTVGDNPQRLLGTLRQAWERSDLVLTTGGLGPTQGDITRETIASLLGEEIRVDPVLKQNITDYFARRGLEMPVSNIRQATLIPSAVSIPNPRGTAPGWWVEKNGKILVCMPGPPGEMQEMWQSEVFPRLQAKSGAIILSRTLKTFGVSESKIEEMVRHMVKSANPTLATYAKVDGIYLRIAAKASRPTEAQEMISRYESEIRSVLGDVIWGADADTQEGVAAGLLVARGLSLGVAESFTDGFLTSSLAGSTQSRSFFKGGLVLASSGARTGLGLEAEGTSPEAAAMASVARQRLGADIGLGVDGYTETVEGVLRGKVFITVESGKARQDREESFSGRYYQVGRRATYYALSALRKFLTENYPAGK